MTINFWVLPGLPPLPSTDKLAPNDIINYIVTDQGVPRNKIYLKSRKREIVFARQLICYYLRKLTPLSLKKIGLMLGGRDHTTVLHGCQTIKDLQFSDPLVRMLLLNYDKILKNDVRRTEAITRLFEKNGQVA